jgi:soluble lytic murein transglycosylase-like protein
MQRSNFVGEVRTLLGVPVLVAAVSAIVCSNEAAARERHGEHHGYSHAAPLTAHHVMPMQASNAAFGFGQSAPADGVSSMAAAQASAAGVPASLVERVIKRESGGNPRAVHAGNYGLMQIRLGTARAMGYTGSAAGLLDPQTNMTYAVRYLAGAYRAAGGNENRAVALYASGYYTQAKARGFSPYATAQAATPAAAFTPVAFTAAEPAGSASVYRVRHPRRHAT